MPTTQNGWNNQVTGAPVTFTGGITSIGTDAAANNINIGTGAAAKTVTIGNTNTTSTTAIKCGTGGYSIASATGTIMNALGTGEITYPLQPSFLAIADAQADVTGDGTGYNIVFATEIFDQNGDFDGSTTFTAPVTGRYFFFAITGLLGITSSHTNMANYLNTSNRSYFCLAASPYAMMASGGNLYTNSSFYADLDAGDFAKSTTQIFNGTKVVDIAVTVTKFGGFLTC